MNQRFVCGDADRCVYDVTVPAHMDSIYVFIRQMQTQSLEGWLCVEDWRCDKPRGATWLLRCLDLFFLPSGRQWRWGTPVQPGSPALKKGCWIQRTLSLSLCHHAEVWAASALLTLTLLWTFLTFAHTAIYPHTHDTTNTTDFHLFVFITLFR